MTGYHLGLLAIWRTIWRSVWSSDYRLSVGYRKICGLATFSTRDRRRLDTGWAAGRCGRHASDGVGIFRGWTELGLFGDEGGTTVPLCFDFDPDGPAACLSDPVGGTL
jgi:hypothetical protein